MTGAASRTCGELAVRVTGLVVASFAMSGLIVWVWSTDLTLGKVALAWLGWCAAITVYAAAGGGKRPRPVCYLLAVVPAASPYLFVVGFYGSWWLLGSVS